MGMHHHDGVGRLERLGVIYNPTFYTDQHFIPFVLRKGEIVVIPVT